MNWAVFYDDGSRFTDEDGSPEEAPSFGVIACVAPNEDMGREVIHGWDWYYFNKICFWGCDLHGYLDRQLHNLPCRALKQGRTIATPDFKAIHKKACDDPDFPVKSAKRASEHPRQI
jgi:hypothetical protein